MSPNEYSILAKINAAINAAGVALDLSEEQMPDKIGAVKELLLEAYGNCQQLLTEHGQPNTTDPRLTRLEMYAWVGEDELGSGEVGIKQALVPAGYIPLASLHRHKLEPLAKLIQPQATAYHKQISLARFVFVEVVSTVNP